jgi:hypothetical protein
MLKNARSAKYKYMYQDDRATRRTHIYEYYETVEAEHAEIQEFVTSLSVNKADAWLQGYMKEYYQVPAMDGQTQPDYIQQRCERLYTWEEMERSWRTK